MKAISLLLLCLSAWSLQAQVEPQVHFQAIRGRSSLDSAFLDYTLQEGLDHPADARFVADRDLLHSLCVSHCAHDSVMILDTLADGSQLRVAIYLLPFDSSAHQLSYFPGTDSLIQDIDGLPAYGAVEALPSKRLDSMSIQIGARQLTIPSEAYRCFYEVNLCGLGLFERPVAAYPSLDGNYLYLYLYGGSGASTFFAKLIFDQERYLTRIVTEYAALREYDAIRSDFVGY